MKINYKLKQLAAILQEARKARQMTQEELAKQAGLGRFGQGHISRIEAGSLDIRASNFIEIARALGFELMLIPKEHIPAVSALTKFRSGNRAMDEAAYVPQKEEDDEQ